MCVGARILVDPADPDDVVAVNALQDELRIRAASERPFVLPDYDQASFDATRHALLALAKGIEGFDRAFGRRDAVDPVRHLIGAAAGWGGLPEQEATYVNVNPGLPVGRYRLTVRDVPVEAFWSISLYNADGYFEPNDRNVNSVNSITATPNDDGSVTVFFGDYDDGQPNCLRIMDGLELPRAALPAAPGGARRLLDIPRRRTGLTDFDHRPGIRQLTARAWPRPNNTHRKLSRNAPDRHGRVVGSHHAAHCCVHPSSGPLRAEAAITSA